jgi:hypothetical protein
MGLRSEGDSWYDGVGRLSTVFGEDAGRPEWLLKWCCMEGETEGYIGRVEGYDGCWTSEEPPEWFAPLLAKP